MTVMLYYYVFRLYELFFSDSTPILNRWPFSSSRSSTAHICDHSTGTRYLSYRICFHIRSKRPVECTQSCQNPPFLLWLETRLLHCDWRSGDGNKCVSLAYRLKLFVTCLIGHNVEIWGFCYHLSRTNPPFHLGTFVRSDNQMMIIG